MWALCGNRARPACKVNTASLSCLWKRTLITKKPSDATSLQLPMSLPRILDYNYTVEDYISDAHLGQAVGQPQ